MFQERKAGLDLEAQAAAFEVRGHAVGISDDEGVFRIPARLAPVIREVCDAIGRAHCR